MTIQIKNTLTKSRNPTEYDAIVTDKVGEVLNALGDGYYLIRFESIKLKKMVKINHKKMLKLVALEWYVHEDDFFMDEK